MQTNLSTNPKQGRSVNDAFASHFAKSMFLSILALGILTFIGTRMFTHIDLNLYGYMIGTIVFIGGFFYRFIAWGERPPTKIIIKKGLKQLFRKSTPKTAAEHLVTYKFIWHRGIYRWLQHFLIGGGCILSCFVTFPLVFGWMYFTMDDNGYYTVVGLGMNLMKVSADGIIAFFFYNALNITAVMVITGVCMALYRRLKNMQARAEQKFMYDFLPLYMLLFISVTGLLLTFMNVVLHGWGQPVMSLIHQFSVIVTLIYLPFGKLAHIPFRPMSVFARNYREHYSEEAEKECKVCGSHFVSVEQSQDVIDVLGLNNMEFFKKEGFHLAELCLPCRRKYRIAQFSGIATHEIKVKEANQNAKG
ncbi:respiratory nitrate reductase subunit gamma [Neobacillus terrae]|uniref:respiratory nitrate reductase subunit gamma n=1 Tax=Neobacillus terrae TaxID=3034837 RepID=UPI0014093F07|nr:respiratory nitrate reductase subunit gamma [Neobacillus terrae]NHM31555.1 respiratory nitrate reductase subunit gamma [Neobacillus terrae]